MGIETRDYARHSSNGDETMTRRKASSEGLRFKEGETVVETIGPKEARTKWKTTISSVFEHDGSVETETGHLYDSCGIGIPKGDEYRSIRRPKKEDNQEKA